jgi:PKD repeat protein
MKATWLALALTTLMIVGSACLDDSITGTRTLTFSLSADPTSTTVGQTVTFRYEGTGTRIQGVVVDYGDGSVDSVFTPGTVVELEGNFVHEYGASGTFQAVGRLETVQAFLSDTVTIQVNIP